MFNTSYGHCPLSKESTEATMALLISLVTRCISWLSAAVITTKTKSNMGGKGYLFCLTASPLSPRKEPSATRPKSEYKFSSSPWQHTTQWF